MQPWSRSEYEIVTMQIQTTVLPFKAEQFNFQDFTLDRSKEYHKTDSVHIQAIALATERFTPVSHTALAKASTDSSKTKLLLTHIQPVTAPIHLKHW